MDFEQLSKSLNLSSRFLQLLATRFNIDNELDLINAANEAQSIKSEVGENAEDEDIVDFMELQREQVGQVQSPEIVQPEIPSVPSQPQPEQLEQSSQPIQDTQTQQEPVAQQPQQERALITQSGQSPEFRYDPNNTRATGETRAGGTNEVINRMFGTDTTISQEYARYNPQLEPRSGINWGTDFVPQGKTVGAEMSNPFDTELKVVRVVDGHGSGGRGRFDQNSGYGNQVIVQRSDTGEILKMSHLQKGVPVQEGQSIKPGQVIARMGDSGNVTGPHLDIEVFDADGNVKDIASLKGSNAPKQAQGNQLIQPFAQQATNTENPVVEPVKTITPPVAPKVERIQQPIIQPTPQVKGVMEAINKPQVQPKKSYQNALQQKKLGKGGGGGKSYASKKVPKPKMAGRGK